MASIGTWHALRVGVLVTSLIMPLVGHAGDEHQEAEKLLFENLTIDVGRGFGDTWNRYAFSMAEFNGQVYTGTWNVQFDYPRLFAAIQEGGLPGSGNPLEAIGLLASEGGEIWRHEGGQRWQRMLKASSENSGFRKMLVYNGRLYAGTVNSTNGAALFASADGTDWEVVSGGPTDNPANISIRALVVYQGSVYVGTENNQTGAELWAYDDFTNVWTHKQTFTDDASVAELIVYNDKLYLGTWDFTDSFQFFGSEDGFAFTNLTPTFPNSENLSNLGVMKLIAYGGQLYLGTVNYRDGFTLLRTHDPDVPDGWEVITTDGLGDRSNAYAWAMVVWDETLYLGTFNDGLFGGLLAPVPVPLDGRAQLWASEDGVNWAAVVEDGFGAPFTYGIRNMLVSDRRLFVGTASNFFVPDLATSLYTSIGMSGGVPAARKLFIGTQVWASASEAD